MELNSFKTAASIINQVKSCDHIFIHGGAATPNELIKLLLSRAEDLTDVTIYHLHTEGIVDYAMPKYQKSFKVRNLFVGANMRKLVDFDRVDYIPCFLSEMPSIFRNKKIKLDYAFIQTSSIDKNGFVSLGTSVDVAKAAVLSATNVVAQINPQMPRTFGDGILSIKNIHGVLDVDQPIYQTEIKFLSNEEIQIGKHVAGLIDDGSCLQMGIGSIPNAVLDQLSTHKNLGLHSEMCSDGVLPLLISGAIDNSKKKFHKNRSVCTFMIGSQKLYDHVHDNPSFFVLEADYVNNPTVIARNSKVVSINSAVEVDLTGQVCADSIGPQIISGVGGQIDFIRGASLSEGGKPIIAISSRTKKGISRIVPFLKEGAGVVTSRAHIHYVVTEYGVADLFAKSLGERAKALIQIAHPADRDFLNQQWFEKYIKIKN
jgi:4-hydroxybutyrate CoA-transferase